MALPSSPAIAIRKAAPADAEALVALGTEVFTASFKDSGCTEEQLQAYLSESYSTEAMMRDITDEAKDLIVAAEAGRILGFCLLTRGSFEPCVDHLDSTVELQRLYVGLDQHGKGVAQALSRRIDDMAREQGFKHIWLGVWEENHKAQRFYAKEGYAKTGEHLFDVGGDLQTDQIWYKAL